MSNTTSSAGTVTYYAKDANGKITTSMTKPSEPVANEWVTYPEGYEEEIALWEINFSVKATKEELIDLLETLTYTRDLKFRKVVQ